MCAALLGQLPVAQRQDDDTLVDAKEHRVIVCVRHWHSGMNGSASGVAVWVVPEAPWGRR